MNSCRWAAAWALALSAGTVTAAHAAPAPAKLAAVTSFTATGSELGTIVVPTAVTLPVSGFHLTASRASYAVVRLIPTRQPATCPEATGARTCVFWQLTYLKSLDKPNYFAGARADQRFFGYFPDYPNAGKLWPGPLRIEVLTDGLVSFSLKADGAGLAARNRVTLRPSHFGVAQLLQPKCTICLGPVATYAMGAQHAVGRHGYVDVTAFELSADNDDNSATGCYYPNQSDPTASPQPSDHPDGCDTLPSDSNEAYPTAAATFNQAVESTALSISTGYEQWWGDASGPVYVGGAGRSVGAAPSSLVIFGLWINEPAPQSTFD